MNNDMYARKAVVIAVCVIALIIVLTAMIFGSGPR